MRTQSSDTDPITERILIELIKKKNLKEKLRNTLSFSSHTIRLSKRAIKRANPGKSKLELDMLFLELHYGKPLADKVHTYLSNKDNGTK